MESRSVATYPPPPLLSQTDRFGDADVVAFRNAQIGHRAGAVPGSRRRPKHGVLLAGADDLAGVVDILKRGAEGSGKEAEIDHRVAAKQAAGFEALQTERSSPSHGVPASQVLWVSKHDVHSRTLGLVGAVP